MLIQSEYNGILNLELNRPEVKNAFHPELIEKLTLAFSKVSPNIRGIILSGAGTHFCAGADLQWMQRMATFTLQENQADAEKLNQMFLAQWNCPVPILCLVHGAAMGGALGLMACSDWIVASPETQLGFTEVKLGILPAVISTYVLLKFPRAITEPLMMTGQIFDAQFANNRGLIHEVRPKSDWVEVTERWTGQLMLAGPEAVRKTKSLLRQQIINDFEVQQRLATELIAKTRVSAEGQSGLKSFLSKSSPPWAPKRGES